MATQNKPEEIDLSKNKIEEHREMFLFLDGLRKSGKINMFGASPYLRARFGITPPQSGAVLVAWMKSFEINHPKIEL